MHLNIRTSASLRGVQFHSETLLSLVFSLDQLCPTQMAY